MAFTESEIRNLLLLPMTDGASLACMSVDAFRSLLKREQVPTMLVAGRRFVKEGRRGRAAEEALDPLDAVNPQSHSASLLPLIGPSRYVVNVVSFAIAWVIWFCPFWNWW